MNFDQTWMADILELQKKAATIAQGNNSVAEMQGLVTEVLNQWGINNQPWHGSVNDTAPFWAKGPAEAPLKGNLNIDISETKNKVMIETVIPGVEDKNDLQIGLQDDILSITGKSNRIANEGGAFNRKVRLPAKVTVLGAEASYQGATLKIILPKTKNPDCEIITISLFQPDTELKNEGK